LKGKEYRNNKREMNRLEGIIENEQTPKQHFERRSSFVKGSNFISPKSMLRASFQACTGIHTPRYF